jgi:hypothetical protein
MTIEVIENEIKRKEHEIYSLECSLKHLKELHDVKLIKLMLASHIEENRMQLNNLLKIQKTKKHI